MSIVERIPPGAVAMHGFLCVYVVPRQQLEGLAAIATVLCFAGIVFHQLRPAEPLPIAHYR